jgi:S-adenosylmethionine decarboxylase
MTRPDALRRACLDAVSAAGLQPVGELFHPFPAFPAPSAVRASTDPAPPGAGGVTGVVLLAESHLAVHTWPETGAVTLDVYVCNLGADNTQRAHAVLDALLRAFAPEHVERHALHRGSSS